MKKSKKVLALIMALGMTASMVACGTQVGEEVPEGRTQIKISMYAGGYGTEWMENLIDRMNNSQETYWYTRNPDNKAASDEIAAKILGGVVEADIYFTTPADVEELIVEGYLEDLTEVYEYTPEGESLKIKDKTLGYENYEKYLSDENGIYVMPNQFSINSIVYDHDLFERMGWLLTDSGTANGLTKGTDGKEGTYDDGLPQTYEQFVELVETIAINAVPFIYPDAIGFAHMQHSLEAMWAKYEGYDNYVVGTTYNGTYTSPSTGTATSITPSEGWKVYANNLQEGRWKAVDFLEKIYMDSRYMYNDLQGLTHTDAQGIYVTSHATQKPIAMLLDGAWWENEAKRAFADDAAKNGDEYAFGKRDFRTMPVPSFEGQNSASDGKHYFNGGVGGSSFAIKQDDPVKKQGVIEFFKEYASDWNCKNYTNSSGCRLPFKYTLTEDEMNALSPYARNIFEIANDENAILLDSYWLEKSADINTLPGRWDAVVIDGIGTYNSHWVALKAKNVTVQNYKDGLLYHTYTQANWQEKTK